MPHFAEIDAHTNEVLRVIRAESKLWCEYRLGGKWIATEKSKCGIGYIYHPDKDNFSTPQPYPTWTLDDQCHWQPPVAQPDDDNYYTWDEESQTWISSEGM